MAMKIAWWQAAEIIGISDWQMRGWKHRYQEHGYDGLWDRRREKRSPRRLPVVVHARHTLEFRQEEPY